MDYSYENNYDYIIDNIYIGNIFSIADEVLLKKLDQIISLVKVPKLLDRNIEQYSFVCNDDSSTNIINIAKQIYPYLCNAENKPTLIHCIAGHSRSVSCVIYYLMVKYNMSFENAYSYIEKVRPNICINRSFEKQLKKLKY